MSYKNIILVTFTILFINPKNTKGYLTNEEFQEKRLLLKNDMLEWLRPVISAKYVDLYPIYKEYTEKISDTDDRNIAKHSI